MQTKLRCKSIVSLLLLALGLADIPVMATPEPFVSKSKEGLLGDFGPHPYPPGAGRPREAWESGLPKIGPTANWPPATYNVVWPTDIYHLKKSKDGRLQLGSYADEKLFLRLSKDETLKLLGVPLRDKGDVFEYSCSVKSTHCYLKLLFVNGNVTFANISVDRRLDTPKSKQ
jgi:hypothetical protein